MFEISCRTEFKHQYFKTYACNRSWEEICNFKYSEEQCKTSTLKTTCPPPPPPKKNPRPVALFMLCNHFPQQFPPLPPLPLLFSPVWEEIFLVPFGTDTHQFNYSRCLPKSLLRVKKLTVSYSSTSVNDRACVCGFRALLGGDTCLVCRSCGNAPGGQRSSPWIHTGTMLWKYEMLLLPSSPPNLSHDQTKHVIPQEGHFA